MYVELKLLLLAGLGFLSLWKEGMNGGPLRAMRSPSGF
nr:hypothetical protein Q903MT_gene5925 [Picea sitchensis]